MIYRDHSLLTSRQHNDQGEAVTAEHCPIETYSLEGVKEMRSFFAVRIKKVMAIPLSTNVHTS